jgi:hypothetical protein
LASLIATVVAAPVARGAALSIAALPVRHREHHQPQLLLGHTGDLERHGLPYNSGPLHRQFGSVVKKIVRLALPGGDSGEEAPAATAAPATAGAPATATEPAGVSVEPERVAVLV